MDIERIRLAEEEQVESQKSDKKLSSSKVIYKRWDYYYYNKSQSQSQQQKRAMMHTGVSTSKVLILVGAGLTGSVVLRSGRLSDVILQLQELMKGVNKAETSSSGKYDTALLAAQVQRLAQEIRELTLSRPVTILNGDSATADGHDSGSDHTNIRSNMGWVCFVRVNELSCIYTPVTYSDRDVDMFLIHLGNLASYLVPAAAVGAMGYCYMWWKA
ncbi:hypothetical protein IFM89_013416 [Coptis chinensis]|uniref:Uncharacterized protein n=1 Tax=Coptis chinensis TaxID=261450 RepID=A0A835LE78_9MAGN|nr:hypothetical protein IFM89_013416 [Coptis chinensis]